MEEEAAHLQQEEAELERRPRAKSSNEGLERSPRAKSASEVIVGFNLQREHSLRLLMSSLVQEKKLSLPLQRMSSMY